MNNTQLGREISKPERRRSISKSGLVTDAAVVAALYAQTRARTEALR
jgi:hypothetical protein